MELGVLLSGNGTNLQAIIDAIQEGALDANIALVVASKPDAYGLKRAKTAGIPTLSLSNNDYTDPLAADRHIVQALQGAGADYVAMAGYMRMVRQPLLSAFPNRIINLHPALLPSFVGAHAIADAYDYGVKVTGVTVHFANKDYDKGPIIAQQPVVVEAEDTLESLEAKIHAVEHALYPQALQWVAEGRVALGVDGKVRVKGI